MARVRGVLNGTSNAVLTALAAGADLDGAVAAARRDGLAEADVSRDLDGRDAVDKLVLIAASLGLEPPRADDVVRAPWPERPSARVRQVASFAVDRGRVVDARVAFEAPPVGDELAAVDGAWNAVVFETGRGDRHVVTGRGAGGLPTAFEVLADLEECVVARSEVVPREPGSRAAGCVS